jgi:hypothetical protein
MADTCGMTHNSCNGESFSTRLQKFYNNKSYTIGEDIAAGSTTPQAAMKLWLMDPTNNVPAVDLAMCGTARCDGHRWNIMNKGYREMGTGYAYGAMQYNYFWCQDFGGGKPEFDNPIVSGVHVFTETGKTTFMANYFDSIGKPLEASLYVDNQKTAMTLLMGGDSVGTYGVALTKGSACRYYYFAFTDSKGKAWRYPETGYLVTQGEGACARDFVPPESLSVRTGSLKYISEKDQICLKITGEVLTAWLYKSSNVLLQSTVFDASGRLVTVLSWKNDMASSESTISGGKKVYRAVVGRTLRHGVYLVKSRLSNGLTILQRLEVVKND